MTAKVGFYANLRCYISQANAVLGANPIMRYVEQGWKRHLPDNFSVEVTKISHLGAMLNLPHVGRAQSPNGQSCQDPI